MMSHLSHMPRSSPCHAFMILGTSTSLHPCPLRVDAVEKVAVPGSWFLEGRTLLLIVLASQPPIGIVGAKSSDATHASVGSGGGPSSRRAMVLRFCTMAARWNSSRAPESPLSRMRSKP